MTRKIGPVTTASAAGGALATLITWLLSLAGVDMPIEAQGALVVLLTLAGGWLVPGDPGKHTA